MKRGAFLLIALAGTLLVLMCSWPASPAAAQDPIGGALATLAAATAQAERTRSAQRATAQALSAQATRSALEELTQQRAMTATAQAQIAQATQSALDELARQRAATATTQAQSLQAIQTAQASSAQSTATVQAQVLQAQATDTTRRVQEAAANRERISLGLLAAEIILIVAACFVLWQVVKTLCAWADRLRPRSESPLAGLIASAPPASAGVVIDAEPTPAEAGRMPDTVTVIDDPRLVEAIEQWAEEYDRQHEEGDANKECQNGHPGGA